MEGGGKGSKIRDLSIPLGYNPPLSSKGRAGLRRSARWFGSVGPLNVWSLAQAGASKRSFPTSTDPRPPADGVLSQIDLVDGWVVHCFHRYWEWG
jgi:hypothetical protein